MSEIINAGLALLTIGLGLFGFIAPRYTAQALDLAPTDSTMGLSEMRASVGGLFVAMGLMCLASGAAGAYAMLGIAYAGAASGRLVSILRDAPPPRKAWVFFLFEAVPAGWLLAANAVPQA